jgi:hypothetical protein
MNKFLSAVVVMAVVSLASQNAFAAPKKKAAPKQKPVVAQKSEAVSLPATPARTITPVLTAAPVAAPAAAVAAPVVFEPGLKLGYDSIFDGGTLGELDGEDPANEPGANLNWAHIPRIGWKFTKNFSLNLAQTITQFLGPQETKPNAGETEVARKEWLTFGDPYVTASWGTWFTYDKFSLPTYIRYYIPFSRASAQSAGAVKDAANGAIRFNMNPTYALSDIIELSMLSRIQYRIPGISQDLRNKSATVTTVGAAGTAYSNREDFYLMFAPAVAVQVTPMIQPYIQYSTGRMTHTRRTNHLTKLNDPANGQAFELGVNLSPTPKFGISLMADLGNETGSSAEPTGHTRSYQLRKATWEIDLSYTIF